MIDLPARVPHERRSSSALALGLGAIGLLLADVPLDALTPRFSGATLALPFLPFALVGFALARRRPGNPIGWLLLALAWGMGISYAAGPYAVLAFRDGHAGVPLARIASLLTASWAVLLVMLPLPILLFPEGRLPSRRWRWPLRAYLSLAAVILLAIVGGDGSVLTARHVVVDSLGEPAQSSSSGFGAGGAALAALLFLGYAGLSLSFIARQVLGLRRSTGIHRQQLKWLLSGAVLAVAGAIATVSFGQSSSAVLSAVSAVGYLAVMALPLAIGIGVLRYRLYEIDRLISRTLSYALLTALLAGTFIGLVALSTDALALSGRVGVAASTLAALALLHPLRVRVQRVVDRRFNRARYDAEATVAAFAARLRDAVELEAIRADLLDAVRRSVEPASATLWIRSSARPRSS